MGAVEVRQPQLVNLANVRRRRSDIRKQVHTGAALADEGHFHAGLPEWTGRDGAAFGLGWPRIRASQRHTGEGPADKHSTFHTISFLVFAAAAPRGTDFTCTGRKHAQKCTKMHKYEPKTPLPNKPIVADNQLKQNHLYPQKRGGPSPGLPQLPVAGA